MSAHNLTIPIELRYLTTEEAAQIIGYAPQTLRYWRTKDLGPTFHAKANSVRYKFPDLVNWMEADADAAQTRASDLKAKVQACRDIA